MTKRGIRCEKWGWIIPSFRCNLFYKAIFKGKPHYHQKIKTLHFIHLVKTNKTPQFGWAIVKSMFKNNLEYE